MKDRGLCTTFVYKWRLLHKEQNLSKKYLYDTFKNIVKILCLVKNMLYLCSFCYSLPKCARFVIHYFVIL